MHYFASFSIYTGIVILLLYSVLMIVQSAPAQKFLRQFKKHMRLQRTSSPSGVDSAVPAFFVESELALTPRKKLLVVRHGEERFMLSDAMDTIQFLSALQSPQIIASADKSVPLPAAPAMPNAMPTNVTPKVTPDTTPDATPRTAKSGRPLGHLKASALPHVQKRQNPLADQAFSRHYADYDDVYEPPEGAIHAATDAAVANSTAHQPGAPENLDPLTQAGLFQRLQSNIRPEFLVAALKYTIAHRFGFAPGRFGEHFKAPQPSRARGGQV